MKKTFYSICLLLSTLAFSCTDKEEIEEEVKPKDLRIAKVTAVDSSKPNITATYTFKYNAQGNLFEYTETNLDFVADRKRTLLYPYDAQNRLSETNGSDERGKTVTYKEAFIYDNSGKVSSIAHFSGNETSPHTIDYFLYDAKGRVSRINISSRSLLEDKAFNNGVTDAILFEYDSKDNVVRETSNAVLPYSGELQVWYDQRATYDDKKNPFYRLGSPNFVHGHKRSLLNYYMINWSPNNPTQLTTTIYSMSVSTYNNLYTYKYNEQGLPTEIVDRTSTHTLEYEAK